MSRCCSAKDSPASRGHRRDGPLGPPMQHRASRAVVYRTTALLAPLVPSPSAWPRETRTPGRLPPALRSGRTYDGGRVLASLGRGIRATCLGMYRNRHRPVAEDSVYVAEGQADDIGPAAPK